MVDGRGISGAFPARVAVSFSPRAWEQVGRLSKREFEALQQLINDLAERLTLGALTPVQLSSPFEWRFDTLDGTTGRCLVDLENRSLTFLDVGSPDGSRFLTR